MYKYSKCTVCNGTGYVITHTEYTCTAECCPVCQGRGYVGTEVRYVDAVEAIRQIRNSRDDCPCKEGTVWRIAHDMAINIISNLAVASIPGDVQNFGEGKP